jgi:hypothetical protein
MYPPIHLRRISGASTFPLSIIHVYRHSILLTLFFLLNPSTTPFSPALAAAPPPPNVWLYDWITELSRMPSVAFKSLTVKPP